MMQKNTMNASRRRGFNGSQQQLGSSFSLRKLCLLALAVAVFLCLVPLEQFVPPAGDAKEVEPWELPNDELHAVIYFKEESHSIIENIMNLLSQGYTHIYLVDNGSKHPLPMKEIHLLERRGLVTFTQDKRPYIQRKVYRKYSWEAHRKGVDWIQPVDSDEYPWATKFGTVQKWLALRDDNVCSVAFPFKFFGSDGRIDQPNSVPQGFFGRWLVFDNPKHSFFKSVARPRCMFWMKTHYPFLLPWYKHRGHSSSYGLPRERFPPLTEQMEVLLPDVVINHYQVQSYRYYADIKMTRGDPTHAYRKAYDQEQFLKHDHNDKEDAAFAEKVRQRFPALYEGDLALKPNHNYTSPWPFSNFLKALDQVGRHQVLAILDACDAMPDTLPAATRNAAILDTTFDCVVRVPPGHTQSVVASKVTKLCKTIIEPSPERSSFRDFVDAMRKRYPKYSGYVVMDSAVRLSPGADTSSLSRAAMNQPHSHWGEWNDGLDSGVIQMVGTLKDYQ